MATRPFIQTPLGGTRDPFYEPVAHVVVEDIFCVMCGEPIMADDESYEVNHVGPTCSLQCADAARRIS